jgi:hypothetical protein
MGDSTIQAEKVTKRRRWRVRFGLRSLLIVVTLICVLLGSAMLWYQAQATEYHRQQAVVARIEKPKQIGNMTITRCWVQWESNLPHWLRWGSEWKIAEPFRRVTSLCLGLCYLDYYDNQSDFIDEFSELPTLEIISCNANDLTPEILDRLARIKSLKQLYLNFGSQNEATSSEENVRTQMDKIRKKLPGVEVIHGCDSSV